MQGTTINLIFYAHKKFDIVSDVTKVTLVHDFLVFTCMMFLKA